MLKQLSNTCSPLIPAPMDFWWPLHWYFSFLKQRNCSNSSIVVIPLWIRVSVTNSYCGSYVNSKSTWTNAKLARCFLQISPIILFISLSNWNSALKYSATRSIFYKTNQFEEKFSKVILFVMVKITPICAIWPWCINIYFIYFTSDLGTDAFELPCPMW